MRHEDSEPKFQVGDVVKYCGERARDGSPVYWVDDIILVGAFLTYVLVRQDFKHRINIGGPRGPQIEDFRRVEP